MGFNIDNPLEVNVGNSGIAAVPNDPPYVFAVRVNRTYGKATLRAQVSDKAG